MGWNEKASQTVEQRSKEESNDYRYFPEPDLPILHVNKQMREELLANIPELPAQKRSRFKKEYGLPEADIASLIDWKELNEYFEETVSELEELLEIEKSSAGKKNEVLNGDNTNGGNAANSKLIKMAANWCLQDCSALLNAAKLQPHDSEVKPENLAGLIKLIDQGKISITAGKQVFAKMFEHGGEASHIIEDLGLAQVSDVALIAAAVEAVIAAQPKAVADYKAGQQKSFGFLVGMVMRELQGKGNPQVVNEILTKKLN
jgi:aspartyl-tRNA(Asn)/glutamyl-tRNA(Gln) amidotransferase subunit B